MSNKSTDADRPVHDHAFEGAGKTYRLNIDGIGSDRIVVEDYWDRVYGRSWQVSDYNPAAMAYGMRAGFSGLPTDDDVVYGKVDGFGHIVHVSELGDVIADGAR